MRALYTTIIALLTAVGAARTEAADTLTIATEQDPPFSVAHGSEVAGFATDILRAALDQAQITYRIMIYPWQRSYEMALHQENACVYSLARNAQREDLFKWVGPLTQDDAVILARADNIVEVHSLADLMRFRIGSYQGDSLALYLQERGLTIDEALFDGLNPKKLEARRIDFWATGRLKGRYLAAEQGVTDLKEVLIFKKVALYLGCNRGVPDRVIGDLNMRIRQMNENGTIARLRETYQ